MPVWFPLGPEPLTLARSRSISIPVKFSASSAFVIMMLFSEMSLWRMFPWVNSDWCALIASRSAVRSSAIESNSLIGRPAGEMAKQKNWRSSYSPGLRAYRLYCFPFVEACSSPPSWVAFDLPLLNLDFLRWSDWLLTGFRFPEWLWMPEGFSRFLNLCRQSEKSNPSRISPMLVMHW